MAYVVKQRTKTGRVHIYLAESHYVAGKGARQTRTYLGVLSDDGTELLKGFSTTEKITPEVLKLLQKKEIHCKGNQADSPGRKVTRNNARASKPRLSTKVVASSATFEHGRRDLLQKLAEDSGLLKCLNASFDEKMAERIICLAMYQVCESSALYLASEWCLDTNVNVDLSSASVSRTLEAIGRSDTGVQSFFQHWIEANNKPTSLVHDTTSISSYSETIDDLEWGYNRDCENLPQINIAMVADRSKKIPLWYRILPGSIPDVASLKKTCEIVSALGIDKFTFSLDRGFFSKSNIASMIDDNVDFIIGVPCHQNQPRDIIKNNITKLFSSESMMLYNGGRFRYTTVPYIVDDNNQSLRSVQGHLFLDSDRREAQLKKLEVGVTEVLLKTRDLDFSTECEAKEWIKNNCGPLSRYFLSDTANNRHVILLKKDSFDSDCQRCGVVLLLTSLDSSSPSQVLSDYRSRDLAEKIFDKLKNGVGLNRIRCSGNTNMNGRVFVAFIATVLRSIMENRLRKEKLNGKYSVDEALTILKRIRSIVLPNGKTIKREIPARCREILGACLEVK